MPEPFRRTLSLAEMSPEQWESLCDGCGKCCLHKLEDEDTGEVFFTNVACHLLDLKTIRCRDYVHRSEKVPECLNLSADSLNPDWLPATCAYRLLAEGRDLPDWHPLRSGTLASVAASGHSIKGRVVSETEAGDLECHLTDWD